MIKTFISVALIAVAAPAFAAADPAAVTAATALVEQLGVKAQIADGMNRGIANMRSGAMITQMLSQQPGFEAARAKQPAKFDEVLKKAGGMQANAAQKVVNEQLPLVVNAAIQSYATNYTAAELKQLSDFYRSPLGIAYAAKQPKVAAGINDATSKLMGAKIQAAMQALAPQINVELARLQPAAAAPPAK
jgi:uncharacterized protein